ncbi:MAG: AmmeMemoRadiSam system protein B [Desulfurococcaceae archaeon]
MLRYVRKPVVAGYFYPSNRDRLVEIIEWSFKHRIGPGSMPKLSLARDKTTIGYVVPHAGYMYSGPVAAHAYYDMVTHGVPETIVIIGTNHTGYGKPVSVYPGGVWETPLGSIKVDEELGKKVVEASELADLDTYAHLEEHSIEVQLPFLQYIYKDKQFQILPIVMGIHSPEVARDLAKALISATRELSRDTVFLASSDFNHYEPHDVTVDKDMDAINRILNLDLEGFYNTMIQRDISICGPGGIMVLMEIARIMGGKAILLKHATSGDVQGGKSAVVGYASIKFFIE